MKRFKTFFLALFVLVGCQEKEHEPLVGGIGSSGVLTNLKVENLPGASKISYSLPDDQGFLYVLAEYVRDNGEVKTVKSSNFKNYVLLEGFGQEKRYDVKLYTVSRSEDKSEPIHVEISPLKAPVHVTFGSLDMIQTFGGVAVSYTNESGAEYIIHTLYKNELGEWTETDRNYSAAKESQYAVRGFEPVSTDFAVYVTDKWQNSSDTLYRTLTPLYEEELDKSRWKDLALLDDFNEPLYSPLYQLWTPGDKTYFFQSMAKAPEKAALPNWVTIDFGREYILGRMKVNQVSHSNTWRYGSCSPQIFEIWGSNSPSTNWNDWTLIGQFESIKPSGLPVGQWSDDDLRVNAAGEEFDMAISDNSYRYIRFKTLKTWGGVNYMCMLELTFWGQATQL